MYRVRARVLGGFDDFLNDEITLYRGGRTDMHSLVRQTHMQRFAISIGIDSDSRDAHFTRCLNHATGNFTAVRNQYFCDLPGFYSVGHYMRNTPKRVSSKGAFAAIANPKPRTRLVSAGAIIPSSQMRALA